MLTAGPQRGQKVSSRQKNRATHVRKNRVLDNSPDSRAICVQIERLSEIAGKFGSEIGIGHPYDEPLETPGKYQDRLKGGFDVFPVPELVG